MLCVSRYLGIHKNNWLESCRLECRENRGLSHILLQSSLSPQRWDLQHSVSCPQTDRNESSSLKDSQVSFNSWPSLQKLYKISFNQLIFFMRKFAEQMFRKQRWNDYFQFMFYCPRKKKKLYIHIPEFVWTNWIDRMTQCLWAERNRRRMHNLERAPCDFLGWADLGGLVFGASACALLRRPWNCSPTTRYNSRLRQKK